MWIAVLSECPLNQLLSACCSSTNSGRDLPVGLQERSSSFSSTLMLLLHLSSPDFSPSWANDSIEMSTTTFKPLSTNVCVQVEIKSKNTCEGWGSPAWLTRTSLAEREDELFFAIEPRCLLLHSATIASWNNLLLLPILEGGKVLGRDNKLLPRRGQSRAKGWKRSRKVDIVACWKLDNDWTLNSQFKISYNFGTKWMPRHWKEMAMS